MREIYKVRVYSFIHSFHNYLLNDRHGYRCWRYNDKADKCLPSQSLQFHGNDRHCTSIYKPDEHYGMAASDAGAGIEHQGLLT